MNDTSNKDIDEILEELFSERLAYKHMDLNPHTWNKWKLRFREGGLKHETKQKILQMFGYRMVRKEMWV